MRMFTTVSGVALIMFAGTGIAAAQPAPVRGTPASPFPYAAAHEVQDFNGVPCRTMYVSQLGRRVPIKCAGDVYVPKLDAQAAATTTSPAVVPASGAAAAIPVAGTPASPFPYAARHEIRMINGVPCRTAYAKQLNARVPIQCAGDVLVSKVN